MRKGMSVRARWPECGADRKVRLAARVELDCATMRGTVRAAKAAPRPFVAVRSTCGDDVVDVAGGEECDVADVCPGSRTCQDCLCAGGPTTTTVTATTSTTAASTTTTSSTVPPTTSPNTTTTVSTTSSTTATTSSTTTSTTTTTAPGTLPPDPSTVAPPVEDDVATTVIASTAF